MEVFNPAIAFGLTPFETIYFQNKKPERLEMHYKRLLRASRVLNILYEGSFDDFNRNIIGFIESSNEKIGVLKVILINGKLEFNIRRPSYTKEGFQRGIDLNISKIKRDPRSIFTYFKTLNYGLNVLEDNRAKNKGYNGCVFTNINGHVCETSYANIFFRKGNTLYTPHLRCGILPGVMRRDIINFARDNGYIVEKVEITINMLKYMEESFISNSVSAVYPVRRIEDINFKSRNFIEKITKDNIFQRPWNI